MSADNTLGGMHKTDPVYAVSNLSTLFTVSALALQGTQGLGSAYRERALDDIRLALELFALVADDVANTVERAISKEPGFKEAAE
jgi:hypothetical protein